MVKINVSMRTDEIQGMSQVGKVSRKGYQGQKGGIQD